MNERKPIRQGDVMLVPIEKVPEGAQSKRPVRKLVLAEGETTGHHHVLQGDKLEELLLPGDVAEMEQRFVRVLSEGATLVHEEHSTLAVPVGDYELRGQREHSPEEVRRVAD